MLHVLRSSRPRRSARRRAAPHAIVLWMVLAGALLWGPGCDSEFKGRQGSAPFSVEGLVALRGAPIPGVEVVFGGTGAPSSVLTQPDGTFRQSRFPSGNFNLWLNSAQYDFYYQDTSVSPTQPWPIPGNQSLSNLDFDAVPVGGGIVLLGPGIGPEPFYLGAPIDIIWQARGEATMTQVRIQYRDEAVSAVWITIAVATMPLARLNQVTWNVHSYQWVPDVTVNQGRIRVEIVNYPMLFDESTGNFPVANGFTLQGRVTIDGTEAVSGATVDFIGPNAPLSVTTSGTGLWTASGFAPNSGYTIRLTGTGTTNAAPLPLLTVFGLSQDPIQAVDYDAEAGNKGDFPTDLTLTLDGTPGVIGDINFLAAPAGYNLTVLRPTGDPAGTGGDVWLDGYFPKPIEWQLTGGGTGSFVDIHYSGDAGQSWPHALFAGIANLGLVDWKVGEDINGNSVGVSPTAAVRVIDTTYRLVRGASPEPFVLQASAGLTVETQTAAGGPLPDVLFGIESPGFINNAGLLDPLRMMLTSTATNAPATDQALLPEGLYRLAPNRVGWEYSPAEETVGLFAASQSLHRTFVGQRSQPAWEPLSVNAPPYGMFAGAPSARAVRGSVWTGSQFLVWGGVGDVGVSGDGFTWTPGPNGGTWEPMSAVNAPAARFAHTLIWTGRQAIVWGGQNFGKTYADGGIWTPGPNGGSWQPIPDTLPNAPPARRHHSAVWTGTQMLVWGGADDAPDVIDPVALFTPSSPLGDGAVWTPGPGGGSWKTISGTGAPSPRSWHEAVWTGTEMLVWGGVNGTQVFGDGARYDPAADTWLTVSGTGAPGPKAWFKMTWTGSEAILWGGGSSATGFDDFNNEGAIYNPATDTWRSTPMADPSGLLPPVFLPFDASNRGWHTAVWTGTELLVWGGAVNSVLAPVMVSSGLIWTDDGAAGSWRAMNGADAPFRRGIHAAAWTGTQMVVFGGASSGIDPADGTGTTRLFGVGDGGIFTPDGGGGRWQSPNATGAPAARMDHTAVWTGRQMVVFGGEGWLTPGNPTQLTQSLGDGATWTPRAAGGVWLTISGTNAPSPRAKHTAVWTGDEMVVWGGRYTVDSTAQIFQALGDGALWRPATGGGVWLTISGTNAPLPRWDHTAVWTGSEMIVWGGRDVAGPRSDGAAYDPAIDTWVTLSGTNAPAARSRHRLTWTGTEMIVWGGRDVGGPLGEGAAYDPATDIWVTLSGTNAPPPRFDHTAVWTGTQMVVWGGNDSTNNLATGAIWTRDGGAGTWGPIAPAPAFTTGRSRHTAVWTGTEMMVWGGLKFVGSTGTGGVWRPDGGAGQWRETTEIDVPRFRDSHTAVWTGWRVVVWGGHFFDGIGDVYENTGAQWAPRDESDAKLRRIRRTNAATLPVVCVPLPAARVLCLEQTPSGPVTKIYNAPNRTIDVHNHPVPMLTVTSTEYPDFWSLPVAALGPDAPANRFGVAAGHLDGLPAGQTGVAVWGGADSEGTLVGGAFFNETANQWLTISTSNEPARREDHLGIAIGDRFLIWGGRSGPTLLDDGGIYERANDLWLTLSGSDPDLTARVGHRGVYGGNVAYVFGGRADGNVTDDFVYLNESTPSQPWEPLPTGPSPREKAFVFWSAAGGGRVVVWGGLDQNEQPLHDGGLYDPAGSAWTPIPNWTTAPNAPPPATGRQAAINPQNGHLLVYGGLTVGGSTQAAYDMHLYEFDPASGQWLPPVPFGDPSQPQLDFRLIHTGLGTRNNILMLGGTILGVLVEGGFIR